MKTGPAHPKHQAPKPQSLCTVNTLYYNILLYTIIYYNVLLYTIIYYYILLYTIIYYYILLYTIIYYYILLYTIIYYYILLYTVRRARHSARHAKKKQATHCNTRHGARQQLSLRTGYCGTERFALHGARTSVCTAARKYTSVAQCAAGMILCVADFDSV